jgi:hypothetical protein
MRNISDSSLMQENLEALIILLKALADAQEILKINSLDRSATASRIQSSSRSSIPSP